jgi:RNA polymerase sigma-B factor
VSDPNPGRSRPATPDLDHPGTADGVAAAGDAADRAVDPTLALFAVAGTDADARDELVRLHTPLARYLARRFQGRGEPLEDLTQVAMIGLLKAIDRFDVTREIRFTTYATATIAGELKRHFRDKAWSVRVPRRLQETALRVSRVVGELSQELGRSPTVAEVAARTQLSDEEVIDGLDAVQAYSAQSLDAPSDEDGTSSAERLGTEDDLLETMEGWASVAPALRALPARERRILYLRFYQGQTQTQIAESLDISQMHVSRLLARTLRRLREAVGETDEPEDDGAVGEGSDMGDEDG